MSTSKRKSKVKLIALLIIITGALGVVGAGVTLGMASSELKAEHLTVSAMTPAGTADVAGTSAAGPLKVDAPAAKSQGASNEAMGLSDSRNSLTNGSFLRALFTIALAVAAPVMGIGLLVAVVDLGPLKGPRRR